MGNSTILTLIVIAGCPAILRGDHGTENSDVAAIHIAMRYSHHDSLARGKSFIYGPSKFNTVSLLWASSALLAIC